MPVRLLGERGEVRAFRHPRPAYPLHLLIVPRRSVADYLDATPSLLADVLKLAAEMDPVPGASSFDLVTNLGQYQEVKLLHFHVVPAADGLPENEEAAERVEQLLADTTAAARSALACTGRARVVLCRTSSGYVRWSVT